MILWGNRHNNTDENSVYVYCVPVCMHTYCNIIHNAIYTYILLRCSVWSAFKIRTWLLKIIHRNCCEQFQFQRLKECTSSTVHQMWNVFSTIFFVFVCLGSVFTQYRQAPPNKSRRSAFQPHTHFFFNFRSNIPDYRANTRQHCQKSGGLRTFCPAE